MIYYWLSGHAHFTSFQKAHLKLGQKEKSFNLVVIRQPEVMLMMAGHRTIWEIKSWEPISNIHHAH